MTWDTNLLLHDVWQQNLPLFHDRLRQLEAMSAAATDHTLTVEQRDQAESIAHQLAGSLGMFGFPEGTRLARELEFMLAADNSLDPARCNAVVTELHQLLNF